MIDILPRAVMLRLLAILAIVLVPHVQRLPLWEVLLVATIGLWRLLATLRQWRPMPRWLRVILTIGAFVGVYASFGNVSGQAAGVALLTVMAALKLTELNKRRDVMVMVLLMYFILITHFLFSQEMWTVIYLLLCAVLITSLLVEANHPDGALPLRASLRLGGRLVLHALPLMVVLFLLVPRIPGPLWGLPTDAGAALTGLSEDMAPGEIQSLIESDEVAFRVRFNGPVPPSDELYWRGPVLAHFDGRRWEAGWRPAGGATAELGEPVYNYEITLEAQRRPWLLALDLPGRNGLPQDSTLTADYQLVAGGAVKERRVYQLSSHTHYRLQTELTDAQRHLFLQLVGGGSGKLNVAVGGADGGLKVGVVRLNSGEQRYLRGDCMGTVGAVSNPDNGNQNLAKAGRNRWLGKRPLTRGVAKNPVDHPHGGGEGRTSGGRHPVTPWGKPTKGARTRHNKRTDNQIIRSRHAKKKR